MDAEKELDYQAEKILGVLEGQAFHDFYTGIFEDYIGDSQSHSKEEILKKIRRLFHRINQA